MEDLKMIVAQNIVLLRTGQEMTQAQLGERLNYSDKSVSKWERGESIPDVFVLKQIADMFGVTVDWLLEAHDGEVAPPPAEPVSVFRPSVVILLCAIGILTAAFLTMIILWIAVPPTIAWAWRLVICAVPVALITTLVLTCIWYGRRFLKPILSGLLWTLLTALFLTIPGFWWQLYLTGIPLQVLILLSFGIKKPQKQKAPQKSDAPAEDEKEGGGTGSAI